MPLGSDLRGRYNHHPHLYTQTFMKENQHLPNINHISVLTAMVLFAFAFMHLMAEPNYRIGFQAFGRTIVFDLDLRFSLVLLASGLTASGMDWILKDHPFLRGKRTLEHWLVPMFTALVLGMSLYFLPHTLLWWIGFGMSAAVLITVFFAEYVVVSPGDTNYPTAVIVLTVISFTLHLILLLALRYAGLRLFLVTPAIFFATFFVSLRVLNVRLRGSWRFAWSFGIALMVLQISAGLYYWKLSPIRFGLIVLGILYALSSLAANLIEGIPLKQAAVEPITMLVFIFGAGILLG